MIANVNVGLKGTLIASCSPRNTSKLCIMPDIWQQRKRLVVKAHICQTLGSHLPGMPKNTKSGNVSCCMNFWSSLDQNLACPAIKSCHRLNRSCHILLTHLPLLLCRSHETCPQRFTENEHITWLRASLCQNVIRVNQTSHRESILGFIIRDGMSSCNHTSRLFNHLHSSTQHFAENTRIQIF